MGSLSRSLWWACTFVGLWVGGLRGGGLPKGGMYSLKDGVSRAGESDSRQGAGGTASGVGSTLSIRERRRPGGCGAWGEGG